jgi:hypothetical protein
VLNIALSGKKMKLLYLLAVATVLGSSIHTNAMQSEQIRRSAENISNNSDIQKQKQREYGSMLFGVGVGLCFKRHPIIAALCLISGTIALTKQCDGVKEMGDGLSTIGDVGPNDNAVQGAIKFATGFGYFGYSVLRNGVAWVNEIVSNEKNS